MTPPQLFADAFLDYETYLEPGFDAAAYANAVVLATNSPGDREVDLATPLSKVRFDLAEIDKLIGRELDLHHDEILQHAREARRSEATAARLEDAVAEMAQAYERYLLRGGAMI
ncbi:Conserved oligomeric Golgi complex subunit 5 [Neolecta irregularis DAH-3]|uniref:Conserved oligomeric Golgi complex subunit 5 n=1 Tax=Neolecta irregularis (strain DAH-3) TaxID=1198029 RepID=A0A1U7LUT4_NEOID|nr:Conserved oligomeric Golgi complex subunit 5 [Neolecta irregularis DAH-3]|eukprot:OLL26378.1 Conserved oligomeric Golgi complex subunit 5 [Neolecta irregularis DAH-3]